MRRRHLPSSTERMSRCVLGSRRLAIDRDERRWRKGLRQRGLRQSWRPLQFWERMSAVQLRLQRRIFVQRESQLPEQEMRDQGEHLQHRLSELRRLERPIVLPLDPPSSATRHICNLHTNTQLSLSPQPSDSWSHAPVRRLPRRHRALPRTMLVPLPSRMAPSSRNPTAEQRKRIRPWSSSRQRPRCSK